MVHKEPIRPLNKEVIPLDDDIISVEAAIWKSEKTFSSLYLNPGTNASDKQVLTPLQVILKRTAISKD